MVEPLADGRYRLDLSGAEPGDPPGRGRRLPGRPRPQLDEPDADGEGRWERSIKQWIAERVKSTECQSRRALELGQKFVTGVIERASPG